MYELSGMRCQVSSVDSVRDKSRVTSHESRVTSHQWSIVNRQALRCVLNGIQAVAAICVYL